MHGARTGIGIPAELPGADLRSRSGEADQGVARPLCGAGLGLYIVRRLLDVVGGSISLDSQVEVGSTFRVVLPVRSYRADAAVGSGVATGSHGAARCGGGRLRAFGERQRDRRRRPL
ncbi:MAG: ATP-binding protein [Candidatus Binatia bacterium]